MSADNYVRIKKFGKNDYRWGMWSASEENPDFSDKNFKSKSFKTPKEASDNAHKVLGIIEYGVEFDNNCLREDETNYEDLVDVYLQGLVNGINVAITTLEEIKNNSKKYKYKLIKKFREMVKNRR